MNDTYEDLNWIHPDLRSYRTEHAYVDNGIEQGEEVDFYYLDIDSPLLYTFGVYEPNSCIFCIHDPYNHIIWYMSSTADDYCLSYKHGRRIFEYYMPHIEQQAEREHLLFCLKWDWEHSRKDPTISLFDPDLEIRNLAKDFINKGN